MAENGTTRAALVNAGLIVLAAVAYYAAQTAIDKRRIVTLPIQSYLECLDTAGRIDWGRHNITDHPSASEICDERAAYRE